MPDQHEMAMYVLPKTPEWERGFRWHCKVCDVYAPMIYRSEVDARRAWKKHVGADDNDGGERG